jgi:serine/threonine-protein kinase
VYGLPGIRVQHPRNRRSPWPECALKPANIKVRPDGTVKVLDFGLAKLTANRLARQDDPAQSPTITRAAETAMGVTLGTASYMSPEQARGQPVDKRTDVWAFGAVLYEMLTRARAFPGEGIADTIASVVKSTPEWTALPADVPLPVVTLVQRCLEKDRRARIGDIAVARFLLSDAATSSGSVMAGMAPASGAQAGGSALPSASSVGGPVLVRRWRGAIPWAMTVLVVIASAVALWRMRAQPEPPGRLYHIVISGGAEPFRTGSNWEMFALSADGTRVVYSLVPEGSRPGGVAGSSGPLYVRRLDEATANAIPGTEGAVRPILSPDGQWVAFTDATNSVIKRVPIDGGTPTVIAENLVAGGTWAGDNTLVLGRTGGLVRVPMTGGTVTPVLTGGRYTHPNVLPDGSILFTNLAAGQSKVEILPAGTETPQELVLGMHPRFIPPGYLIFARGATLFAATFDPARHVLTSDPVPVLEGVLADMSGGQSNFSVSEDGSLAYIPGPAFGAVESSTLVWFDRNGKNEKPLAFRPQAYGPTQLSGDGTRVLTGVTADASARLWIGDVDRGTLVSVTGDAVADYRFSNDDRRVEYRKADGSIWSRPADLSVPESRLTDRRDLPGTDVGIVSSDGKWRVITGRGPTGKTGSDIWTLDESNRGAAPKPWVQSATNDQALTFSPDGRWLLYATVNPTGVPVNRNELFIQPFPGPGAVLPVSQEGVRLPARWVGQDIIFRDLGGGTVSTLVAARVTTAPRLLVDPPKMIMQVQASYRWDDVTRDGQRFLFRKDASATSERTPATELHVIVNWLEDVRQKLAAAKAGK